MKTSPSTEVAHISTQLLFEQTVRQRGVDRSDDRRILFDADWSMPHAEGETKVRLLQLGLGTNALYAMRIKHPNTAWVDCFHYSSGADSVSQSVISRKTGHTKPLSLTGVSPEALHPYLYEGLTLTK